VSHREHGAVVGYNDYDPKNDDPFREEAHPGTPGAGGWFVSKAGEGVRGTSQSPLRAGVVGYNDYVPDPLKEDADPGTGAGGWFESKTGEGVRGTSNSPLHAGVVGYNTAKGSAGYFAGNVEVTGDLILTGADCAEAFAVADAGLLEPGMVAVVDDDGLMRPCDRSYDTRAAGIVSGAGGVRPAIVLDRRAGAVPLALMGTAWCWCDASASPIAPGDLLTSSDRTGHARRADDVARSFGALVGKALSALPTGTGLVRVLVIPG
jgi:hypothetical protein